MVRFQIRLDEKVFRALTDSAKSEFRETRHQAAFLVRESLEQRGLLQIGRDKKVLDSSPPVSAV